MITFCTLFNSRYLDKGLALYRSLIQTGADFKLYIFALDSECEAILRKEAQEKVEIIGIASFLTQELKKVAKQRSIAEFCWTCTPFTILYVLQKLGAEDCIYLDSDLYFYQNPNLLVQEYRDSGCDAGIIGHHFGRKNYERRRNQIDGKYCVQFNYFRNTENGLCILNWWAEQCMNNCSSTHVQGVFGDQKYVEEFEKKFENVYVLRNQGAGVAPWNIYRYQLVRNDEGNKIVLRDKISREQLTLFFYHFHMLEMMDNNKAFLHVYTRYGIPSKECVEKIYRVYLETLSSVREMLLQKYGWESCCKNQQERKESFVLKCRRLFQKIRRNGICLSLIEIWQFRFCYRKDFMEW